MEAFVKQFVKNKYGASIVKCCASCKHRQAGASDDIRVCQTGHGKHRKDYLCHDGWEMEPGLENAGKGGGRVKRKAYIDFILKNGIGRADEFEEKYGSKYLMKK